MTSVKYVTKLVVGGGLLGYAIYLHAHGQLGFWFGVLVFLAFSTIAAIETPDHRE